MYKTPEEAWKRFCEQGIIPKIYQNCSKKQLDFTTEQIESETLGLSPDKKQLVVSSLKLRKKAYEDWTFVPYSTLLMGPTGTGKTHFMYLLIKHLVTRYRVPDFRFFKMADLDTKLLKQFKEYGTSEELIKQCCDAQHLFLDDLGTDRNSDRVIRELYEIIDYRVADERVTVISTNLNESQIKEDYTAKIASRLLTFSPLIFYGEDKRGRKAHK